VEAVLKITGLHFMPYWAKPWNKFGTCVCVMCSSVCVVALIYCIIALILSFSLTHI
jgi:hypothetical protein